MALPVKIASAWRFQCSVFPAAASLQTGFPLRSNRFQLLCFFFLTPGTCWGDWHYDKEGSKKQPARIIYASVSRDREDDRLTWQPQGLESEAYLNSTSQGSRPEDARKDGHMRSRSRQLMKHPGFNSVSWSSFCPSTERFGLASG